MNFGEKNELSEAAQRLEAYKRMEPLLVNYGLDSQDIIFTKISFPVGISGLKIDVRNECVSVLNQGIVFYFR